MKPTLIFLLIATHIFAGDLVIYEVPRPGAATEGLTVVETWDGQQKVEVGHKHLFSSDDIVRVLVTKAHVPEVTQKQIDNELSKMPEDQRKKVARLWKPEKAKEWVRLSYVFANDAARRFRRITDKLMGDKLALEIGGKIFSSAVVREPISNGVFSVSCTLENADELLALFSQSDPKVFFEKIPKKEK